MLTVEHQNVRDFEYLHGMKAVKLSGRQLRALIAEAMNAKQSKSFQTDAIIEISVKDLRNLIKEVAISPSLKKNSPVDDPLDDSSIAGAVHELGRSFNNALMLDLTIRAMSEHYNEQTRELDDNVYEELKKAARSAANQVVATATKVSQESWIKAHSAVQSQKKSQAA